MTKISEDHPAYKAAGQAIFDGMDGGTDDPDLRNMAADIAMQQARAALNAALPHLKPEDVPGALPEEPSEEAVEAAVALIDDIAAMPGATRATARAALRAAYAVERGVTSRSSGDREGGA